MRTALAGVDREVAGKGAGQAELPGRCWEVPLSLVEDAAVLAVLVAGRDYRSVCVCVCVCGGGGGEGTCLMYPLITYASCISDSYIHLRTLAGVFV